MDDCFECEGCSCYWPDGFDSPGEWHEPGADQCRAQIQPFRDSRYEALRGQVYRCVLAEAHGSRHHHPEYPGWYAGNSCASLAEPAEVSAGA